MNIERALFGSVLALLVVCVGVAWLWPEPPGVGGEPHPEFDGMMRGGPGPERHDGMLGLGWLLGMLIILNAVLLIAFGARSGGRDRALARPLLLAFVLFGGTFTWMMVAYRDFVTDPDPTFVLGFPLPSAILLYVLYPVSMIFNVYFATGFRRWVFREEDEARYRALIAERRARGGETS